MQLLPLKWKHMLRVEGPSRVSLSVSTGGVFTRQAEVVFQPGNERLTIRQEFGGIDEHDHLVVNTHLDGRIPEVPRGATVQIDPYNEIYQYSSNRECFKLINDQSKSFLPVTNCRSKVFTVDACELSSCISIKGLLE